MIRGRQIRFLSAAAAEFRAAAERYESERHGLGDEFTSEVEGSIKQLLTHPHLGPPHHSSTRKLVVKRFRYSIVYRVADDDITVIAIAHHRRRPGYWIRRQ